MKKKTNPLVQAAKNADWMQVVLNQGPPCFHLEQGGKFCLRAQRWAGHHSSLKDHKFVPLDQLLSKLITKASS